ncbi:hypothetical protein [Geodermatophilus sp. SYSU D01036]
MGTAIAFALVGAVTAPPSVVLVAAPAFGVFVGIVVLTANPASPLGPAVRRTAVSSGAGAALAVPCIAGLRQFGTLGSVAATVLIVLSCVAVVGWIAESAGRAVGPALDLDVAELRPFLQVVGTPLLLAEWRAAGEHLGPGADPDLRARALLVRPLLLEELTRRDPAGVARWLSDGDEGAPEQHLRGDSGAPP